MLRTVTYMNLGSQINMKEIWIVETSIMNGTVCIGSICDSFTTKELAEQAAKLLKEKNKDAAYPIRIEVKKSILFESIEETSLL